MNDLIKFLNARKAAYRTNPRLLDEVVYTPYVYDLPPLGSEPRNKVMDGNVPTGDLLGLSEVQVNGKAEGKGKKKSKFDTTATEAEIFLFPYGTVVIWGMTEVQEQRFLTTL